MPFFSTLLAQDSIKLVNPVMDADMPSKLGIGGLWITVAKGILMLSSVGAVVMLLYAGFQWMTAGGSKEKADTARQTVVWVVLGLVVLIAAYALLNTVISILIKATNFQSVKYP